MREAGKLGVRLMLFALAAGILLSAVNALTIGPIKRNQNRSMYAALIEAVGDYTFNPVETDLSAYDKIAAVYEAVDAGGASVGYAYELVSTGYAGAIRLTVGVVNGAVSAVRVSAHTETKGLGTDLQQPFLARFDNIAIDPGAATAVDGMSGATVSSTAVRGAVSQALSHARDVLGVQSAPGAQVPVASEQAPDATTAATGETSDATTAATGEAAPTADASTGATGEAAPATDASTAATGEAAPAADASTGATGEAAPAAPATDATTSATGEEGN